MSDKKEKQLRRFGELYQKAFEGAPLRRFRDIVGQDMVIQDYAERWSAKGRYYVVLAEDVGGKERFTFLIYNQNIMRKIRRAKEQDELPLLGKIVENDGMFDIM